MRKLLTVGIALSLVAVLGLSASAGTAGPAPEAVPADSGPLTVESTEGASSKVTVSGELRARWENQQNLLDFDSDANDHLEYVDARLRLGLLFELADNAAVKVTAQSRYLWGGEAGINSPSSTMIDVDDSDSLDLYEAHLRLKQSIFGFDTTFTVGRQELALGSEMLLGDDTKYAGLSWDAVRIDFKPLENLSTSLFAAKVVENSVVIWEDSSTVWPITPLDDAHIFGIWNTLDLNADFLIDFYLLYFTNQNDGGSVFDEYVNKEKIWTVGARVNFDKLELAGQKFDFSAEVAMQMGDFDDAGQDLDIKDSFAFEVELGWSPEIPWSPRLALGFAWATGDEDPADGDMSHFFSLAQDTQGRLGMSDLFVLENIQCFYVDASCKPMSKEEWTLGITYLRFDAPEEDDAIGIGGDGLVNGAGSTASEVGSEIDFYTSYKISDNADLKLCWAWLDPGELVSDQAALGDDAAHRVHLTLAVKF